MDILTDHVLTLADSSQERAIDYGMTQLSQHFLQGRRAKHVELSCACSGAALLLENPFKKQTIFHATFRAAPSSLFRSYMCTKILTYRIPRSITSTKSALEQNYRYLNGHLIQIEHWGVNADVLCVSTSCRCDGGSGFITLIIFTVPITAETTLTSNGYQFQDGNYYSLRENLTNAAQATRYNSQSEVRVFSQGSQTENIVQRALIYMNEQRRKIESISLSCGCHRALLWSSAKTSSLLVFSSTGNNQESVETIKAILFFEENGYAKRSISTSLMATIKTLQNDQFNSEIVGYGISCNCDPNSVWTKKITQRLPYCLAFSYSAASNSASKPFVNPPYSTPSFQNSMLVVVAIPVVLYITQQYDVVSIIGQMERIKMLDTVYITAIATWIYESGTNLLILVGGSVEQPFRSFMLYSPEILTPYLGKMPISLWLSAGYMMTFAVEKITAWTGLNKMEVGKFLQRQCVYWQNFMTKLGVTGIELFFMGLMYTSWGPFLDALNMVKAPFKGKSTVWVVFFRQKEAVNRRREQADYSSFLTEIPDHKNLYTLLWDFAIPKTFSDRLHDLTHANRVQKNYNLAVKKK